MEKEIIRGCTFVKVQTYPIRSSTVLMANFHHTEMADKFAKYGKRSRRFSKVCAFLRLWDLSNYFNHSMVMFENEAAKERSLIV